MKVLCKCGHDVFEHGAFVCGAGCGCTEPTTNILYQRLRDSDRIRKMCAQLAAAEAEQKLQPVVIHPEVERSA